MRIEAQTRNPGERNNFLNPSIVVTLCCSGAFSARIVAPIIHKTQPIHPYLSAGRVGEKGGRTKSVRLSFRKKCDSMAEMTTERAPIGVTRIASVNALDVRMSSTGQKKTY
jgi:hypothetical protein